MVLLFNLDPIFYMHHANVDRLFSNWIDEQDDSEKLFNKELETSKVLNMFGWKVEGEKPMTISETYSTDSDRLCYIYSDSIRLDEPIVKRQLPGSSSNPGPISCPKPLADKMIAQMNLTSEQIAKIRRKEAMICKFIGFVNDKEHVSLSSRAADSSKHNWVARSPREGIASKQRLRKLVEDYEAENPEPFE